MIQKVKGIAEELGDGDPPKNNKSCLLLRDKISELSIKHVG